MSNRRRAYFGERCALEKSHGEPQESSESQGQNFVSRNRLHGRRRLLIVSALLVT
jgi:hypothetical protein